MKNSIIGKLQVVIIGFTLLSCIHIVLGQQNKGTYIRVDSNKYAPNLYSDKINIQVLLVNLPGLNTKGSNFQGSFKMYFIPEGELENFVQSKGGAIDELNESDISNKVLLGSGTFNKTLLSSSKIYEKIGIPFKQKVSDKQRNMLGKVEVFYTVKIYDAKLKTNVYKNSSFSYSVFDRNDLNQARNTFNLSFFVNEKGQLYTSSLPREKTSTTW